MINENEMPVPPAPITDADNAESSNETVAAPSGSEGGDAPATTEAGAAKKTRAAPKKTAFPAWVPLRYRKDKGEPWEEMTVTVDQEKGLIRFNGKDSKGDYVAHARVTGIVVGSIDAPAED